MPGMAAAQAPTCQDYGRGCSAGAQPGEVLPTPPGCNSYLRNNHPRFFGLGGVFLPFCIWLFCSSLLPVSLLQFGCFSGISSLFCVEVSLSAIVKHEGLGHLEQALCISWARQIHLFCLQGFEALSFVVGCGRSGATLA